jgi:hypothetical protein
VLRRQNPTVSGSTEQSATPRKAFMPCGAQQDQGSKATPWTSRPFPNLLPICVIKESCVEVGCGAGRMTRRLQTYRGWSEVGPEPRIGCRHGCLAAGFQPLFGFLPTPFQVGPSLSSFLAGGGPGVTPLGLAAAFRPRTLMWDVASETAPPNFFFTS